MPNEFVSNWKRLGLKSADDAVLLALGEIKKNEKAIKRLGLTKTITFIWKGGVIEI